MTTLEKINDFTWRLPRRGKMNVDGVVYASEKILPSITEDKALEQVENVATLPGIVKASFAMPDIHWGYGFPIGGVAAFDAKDGVVSPGGVGYDINCLPGFSEVLDEFGCRRRIDACRTLAQEAHLPCLSSESVFRPAKIRYFLKKPWTKPLVRLSTESERILAATPEHPVWTPEGMKPIGEIAEGEEVAVLHFHGVPYEKPKEAILLQEVEVLSKLRGLNKGKAGHAATQSLRFLKERGLLPLKADSPHLPRLLRLIGFLLGDGTLYLEKGRNRIKAAFHGKKEDLESVRRDARLIGMTPSPVRERRRRHHIETHYGEYDFERVEASFVVSSTAFGALLMALGVPLGSRTGADYSVPRWIRKTPLWQQRLFLAAFFGAELSTPGTVTGHPFNMKAAVLDMNKHCEKAKSGRLFLGQISEMLREFGVETQNILERRERSGRFGNVTRLRLVVSARPENLIRLYDRIGYEYNRERSARASLAVAYMKFKERGLVWRRDIADNVRACANEFGFGPKTAMKFFGDWVPNERFAQRAIYEAPTSVRVGEDFWTFERFVANSTQGLGKSGCVWETVRSIDSVSYKGSVYDFTVDDPAHNFIADGFVVSNCGVRLLRTQLTRAEVQGRMKGLVEALFREIPTGVGAHRKDLKLGIRDLKLLLKKGAAWAVENGRGEPEDVEHLESRGVIPGADAGEVSERALERGKDQCGTLGSGNHFVEVGYVEQIFDREAASAFGLFEGQVVVHIHSGSRGLGYQVCDDFLGVFLSASRKYGIELVDRQLSCAPLHSDDARRYLAAMAAAANFAFCNRQIMADAVRRAFAGELRGSPRDLGIETVYDVAHNIAKFEEHEVEGKRRRLCVHRKGATRAFPPGHAEIPEAYRAVGQPVLIPGDMGRYSYVAAGTETAFRETFGSSCHGAGRLLSRMKAKKAARGRRIYEEMEAAGIVLRTASLDGALEEIPEAYKDVADVMDVAAGAGLCRKVARLRPIGVIKG